MKKFIVLSFLSLLSLPAFSSDSSSGCGPGWYIFKDNSLVSSALRLTTNGILFPSVTLGMTLGTSNCTQHKIVRTEQESLKYATENYYELLADTSLGQGEFLSQFSDVIGCQQQTKAMFSSKMRENFGHIFKTHKPQPDQVLIEVYKIILTSPDLTRSCSLS